MPVMAITTSTSIRLNALRSLLRIGFRSISCIFRYDSDTAEHLLNLSNSVILEVETNGHFQWTGARHVQLAGVCYGCPGSDRDRPVMHRSEANAGPAPLHHPDYSP